MKAVIESGMAGLGNRISMRLLLSSLSISPLGLLAACGGGGTDVASTPPPPTYQKLGEITASTRLATQAATHQFSRIDNAPIGSSQSRASNIEISFDPVNKIYTLHGTPVIGSDTPITQTFGPADAISGNPGSYQTSRTTVDRTEMGRLAIGATPLTYANFGAWTVSVHTDSQQIIDTAYFTYGIPTDTGDMPKTGSASYPLQISGTTGVNPVSGTGLLTANFGAGTVDVSLGLQAREISRPGSNLYALGTVTGSGTISATGGSPGFSSDLADGRYTGTINGLFYGPQAAEVGGAFAITRDGIGGGPVAGTVIGKKN